MSQNVFVCPFTTTTAEVRIGSVGVKQADTARLERKLRPGIKAYMKKIKRRTKKGGRRTQVMPGTSRKNKLFQCFTIYAFGNSTPFANTVRL
jgi:adenylyl- and sulfurtransferase ThiI